MESELEKITGENEKLVTAQRTARLHHLLGLKAPSRSGYADPAALPVFNKR